MRLLHQVSQAQLIQRQLEGHNQTRSLASSLKAQPPVVAQVHLRRIPLATCSVERKVDKLEETHWLKRLRI
jgi:hypothetical protein